MAKEPTGAFRTKVRVKARTRPEQDATAPGQPVPPQKRSSLMEALKQVRASPSTDAQAATDTKRESRSPETPQPAEEGRNDRHKPPATSREGRLASSKLKQLQRLREAAAGLEMLARGEIEEATVEIIRRDTKQTTDHQATDPKKR